MPKSCSRNALHTLRLAAVLLGAALAVGEPAFPQSSAEPNYVVAFAQDTLDNDWRFAQASELADEFAKYPEIEFRLTNARGSTALQVEHVEQFTEQQVDVLIVSPRDGTVMTPAISRAYRAGIPIVLLTRRITTDDYTSFVGPNDLEIAAEAARYIARRLGGSGRVIVLEGVPTASTAIDRTEGFVNEIERYPEIEIVAMEPAHYLRGEALLVMDRFLERQGATLHQGASAHQGADEDRGGPPDPGFDAIYAQSDSMAAGARIALEHAGYDPADFVTVGIDYISEAREAIRNGTQDISYLYPTSAAQAAQVAVDILRGNPVSRNVTVPSIAVTRENVELVEPIF